MVKRKISFYERKKEIIYKNMNFARKEKFILWMKRWYYGFLVVKGNLFQRRKLVERSFPSFYETCMIF